MVPYFFFSEHTVATYIDGPMHDHADIAAKDEHIDTRLWDMGISNVRSCYGAGWIEVCSDCQVIFGTSN